MKINRVVSRLMASNMYIIIEGNHAIIVDSCEDTTPGNGLTIDKIILTHEHYDHISGVNTWKESFSAPVLCSKVCSEKIGDARKNLARHFREFCELQTWMILDEALEFDSDYKCTADELFEGETSFLWMNHKFILFEIPGHSPGSIGIILDGKYFFSGDSLIPGSEIELRLPGGSRKDWESIGKKRIEQIKRGTIVYPGHLQEFIYR